MAEVKDQPIRELTEAEIPQMNRLVSESFGYVTPHQFLDDFPIWRSSMVHRYGIFLENQLISHTGIRFCHLKRHDGSLASIAMIGAVATDESHRGKGLSSKLMGEMCRLADEAGCDWIFLWGSEHEFYKKFGFELHGEQFQAQLADLENIPENFIPRFKKGWDHRIFEYLKNERMGVKLTDHDETWISQHNTVSWYYHDSPFAFLGFERGMDLPHMIHEFGGDRNALMELFSFILSQDSEASVLGTEDLIRSFGFDETVLQEEYLCLARPNPNKPHLKWERDFWVSGLSAC